jgi:tripartite-type tricarboxylate transporter receptor subunit TctC
MAKIEDGDGARRASHAVHPSVSAKNTKELVALAKANPGKLTYATASVIGAQRLAAELFKDAAKIDIVNVPYNGGAPATMAVVGGRCSSRTSSKPRRR